MHYRRLWLLVSVLIFAVVAPMVVFYTAGYRWNGKKGVIERNGTLIFDTQPSGATVQLDGQTLDEQTPLTRQDIAPGTYRVRMTRDGYHSWEKTIEVRPERAEFVTDVWLWKDTVPTRVQEGPVRGLAASPDGRLLAVIRSEAGTDVPRIFVGASAGLPFEGTGPVGDVRITWNEESTGALFEDTEGRTWVAEFAGATRATSLPQGQYRWDGGTLIGIRTGERVAYEPSEGIVRRTALEGGAKDRDGSFMIVGGGESAEFVVEDGREDVQYALPRGDWTFAGRERGWLLLRESGQGLWLAFDPRTSAPGMSVSVPATTPPQRLQEGRDVTFLAAGDHELWSVQLGTPAELLLRSGDALIGAAWHGEAPAVFYATTHDVVALGLETRDGRLQTPLARFDDITQFAVMEGALFVAGTRDGQQGLWRLEVE